MAEEQAGTGKAVYFKAAGKIKTEPHRLCSGDEALFCALLLPILLQQSYHRPEAVLPCAPWSLRRRQTPTRQGGVHFHRRRRRDPDAHSGCHLRIRRDRQGSFHSVLSYSDQKTTRNGSFFCELFMPLCRSAFRAYAQNRFPIHRCTRNTTPFCCRRHRSGIPRR